MKVDLVVLEPSTETVHIFSKEDTVDPVEFLKSKYFNLDEVTWMESYRLTILHRN